MNQNNWVRVEDEMPPSRTEVLAVVNDGESCGLEKAVYLPEIQQWFPATVYARDRYFPGNVTHWQPLPELPESPKETISKDELILRQQMLIKQCYKFFNHPHAIGAICSHPNKRVAEVMLELQRDTHVALYG